MGVKCIYFSPCGNVEKALRAMAGPAAEYIDITRPGGRKQDINFEPGDMVFVGVPVYAGRVPNKLLPFLTEHLHGGGAAAVAAVCFGNRSFDNALAELFAILTADGFSVLAAAAVVSEHSFTDRLAPGRPDEADLAELTAFAAKALKKRQAGGPALAADAIPGDPSAPYYTPLGADGQPARFLRATPAVDPTLCVRCGRCAFVCPMGSIDREDPGKYTGICIKCHACIRKCPRKARFFTDDAFLSHRTMLEQNYQRTAESLFIL